MFLSFWLMGTAIVGLALTPPRSSIGIAAPVLVVLFRLLQGFALGGEVGPATALLLELAPAHRRGFYTAFQSWTQDVAILASGLVGFTLSNLLSAHQFEDYGWRIAMLAGAAVVPVGLAIRRSLPETRPARVDTPRQAPRAYLSVAALGLMMILGGTVGVYTRSYATTYAISTLHLKANIAFAGTLVVGLLGVLIDIFSGALSDRVGRKTIMVPASILLSLSIIPVFQAIVHYRSATVFLVGNAFLAVTAAFYLPVLIAWLAESLPPPVRSGSLALIYATSVTLFGGTTQFIITWLIRKTGNPMAPAWYWTAAALVGVVAVLLAHESAPSKVSQSDEVLGELGTRLIPMPGAQPPASFADRLAQQRRRIESNAATNEVDDLDAVAGVECDLVPVDALGNFAVELDGDAIALEVHGRDEICDGGVGFEAAKFARLAVDGEGERHLPSSLTGRLQWLRSLHSRTDQMRGFFAYGSE